jgi:hypothetical protein
MVIDTVLYNVKKGGHTPCLFVLNAFPPLSFDL